ncbi:DUF2868 domain-containing protein [Pseudomonas massiliensis]|uniref:DUF2868 domain-containing protein n=1 Tax=Pseudomonas massiliensis TaxID=522492 RepID=UPI0006939064
MLATGFSTGVRVNKLDTLWLTEAISLRERDTGPLDDNEANRVARQEGGDFAQRWQARALWLARRDGLVTALTHWKQGARLGAIALAILALLSGAGMAATAFADAPRPINVFWAVGSLLGLNLIMLALWFLGLLLGGGHGAWLGRLWLGLSQRLARDAKSAHLGASLVTLLHRHGLNRWLMGAAVHAFWTLCMLATLLTLLLMFAARRYDFAWETTLLHSQAFIALTVHLGTLPAWLGFPVPDAALVQASGNGPAALEGARQAWAGWLVGVVACYGLLPRALLALGCWLRWRLGLRRLRPALDTPQAQRLRERLIPSAEPLGAKDLPAEPAWGMVASAQGSQGHGAVMAAIELDSDQPWPPMTSPHIRDAGILDDRASRHRLLEALASHPAERLLLACDPRRSPDRGTQALLAELSRNARETRVWLLPLPSGVADDPARLEAWRGALEQLALKAEVGFPQHWLEQAHG